MFVWTEELSVGVRELDEQHQHFFELANKVIAYIIEKDMNAERLLLLLNEFANYTLYHLSSEEEYMEKFGCNGAAHLEAHERYRKTFDKLIEEARSNGQDQLSAVAREAANFAGQWLTEHIFLVDKGYTKCFNDHGLH